MKVYPFRILRGKLIYILNFDIIILNPKGKNGGPAALKYPAALQNLITHIGTCERQQARNILPIDFL